MLLIYQEAVVTPWQPPQLGHFKLNVDAVMGVGGVGAVDGLSVANLQLRQD